MAEQDSMAPRDANEGVHFDKWLRSGASTDIDINCLMAGLSWFNAFMLSRPPNDNWEVCTLPGLSDAIGKSILVDCGEFWNKQVI